MQYIFMRQIKRRSFLKYTCLSSFLGFLGCNTNKYKHQNYSNTQNNINYLSNNLLYFFTSIPSSNTNDDITLPAGYAYQVLTTWGDPLFKYSPKFAYGDNTSGAQALQFGENHDGMSYFALPSSKRSALLVLNHEYNNYEYLFSIHENQTAPKTSAKNLVKNMDDYLKPWTAEKVRKAQMALGVSVAEINYDANNKTWQVNINSKYNKRYHVHSPMCFSGPAMGSKHLINLEDVRGIKCRGTFANCANGKTPWGTYLTCEENFHGCFEADDINFTPTAMQKRYGISQKGYGVYWHVFDKRFDIQLNPNEVNCFGWVVEIDPSDPHSIPIKHTALGRFKHENIAIHTVTDGKPLVAYMGDDESNEYIYKYISKNNYDSTKGKQNSQLLTEGTLYVAKFNENKTGEWIPLIYDERFINNINNKHIYSQADIAVFTRYAADLVQATPMDRPEWININPSTGDIYATLTNNKKRTVTNAANPRKNNLFGHIIRWQDNIKQPKQNKINNNHIFNWDIFLMAGNLSQGGTQEKFLFNSPDCLVFDTLGRLWFATDGEINNQGDFAGHGHNQLFCVNPHTKEIKRFLVAPKGAEITGVCFDDNLNTMFVNIQHPGDPNSYNLPVAQGQSKEDFVARNPLYISAWPQQKNTKCPRSATIAISLLQK